jgi:hypothetical protein
MQGLGLFVLDQYFLSISKICNVSILIFCLVRLLLSSGPLVHPVCEIDQSSVHNSIMPTN